MYLMKKYFSCLILTTLFTLSAFAQTKEPQQIDEFSEINSETLTATLAVYRTELNVNSGSILQILIHRGEKQTLGSPYRFVAIMKTELITNGIAESRIIDTYCETEKERKIQVWLLSDKAIQKTCEGEQVNLKTTTLFDKVYYANPDLGSCCSVDEYDDEEAAAALAGFAGELKKSPESKAYLFVYLGTNVYGRGYADKRIRQVRSLDSPNLLREMSRNAVKILTENGIDSSRIILKNGGFKDSTRNFELWIVPKGGEIPKPKPNYFPKKKRQKKK